jgi:cytochrome c-type biogenesis protein
MIEPTLFNLVVLPVGLGLVGFIEPCSIGASLVFIKYLEGKSDAAKVSQMAIFAATRAIFIGGLGILAAVLGAAFLNLQRGGWIVLGSIYAAIGVLYVTGRIRILMFSLGPSLMRLSGVQGSATLGLLFGLNIPACAAPLLLALLGAAAAGGAAGGTLASGFVALALFGFALSLPLVAAVLFAPARRALDWLAALSERLPLWTGLLLIALGLWSIWFGLFVTPQPPA